MPSVSAKQHRLMEAVAHNPDFAKKAGIPQSVGQDFASADKQKPKKWLKAKDGHDKIPGKGDGTKDTVPAILAPGEAVLNKAAAEALGRHNIKKLNDAGVKAMPFKSDDERKKNRYGKKG